MGRIILSCALVVFVLGCGSSRNNVANPPAEEPGAVLNQASGKAPEENLSDGPPESELPALLDLPLYPGAKLVSNQLATAGEEKRYRLKLETSDSAKKVGEFYAKNGLPMEVRETKGQYMGVTKKGNNVLMFAEEKNGKTEISIRVSPATH